MRRPSCIADGARVRVDGDAGHGDGAGVKGVVPLAKARDDSIYGSKAVGLGQAAREGLPLPPGVALSGDVVNAVASGEERALRRGRQGGPRAARARSPSARRRSTRTAPRRASPAST